MLGTQPGPGAPAPDQLDDLAHRLAASHELSSQRGCKPILLDRLEEQEAFLREAHQYFAGAFEVQLALSYAAEWLLDNFYVVERALRRIREDLPRGYHCRLPALETTSLKGYPRVYALALGIFGDAHDRLDVERVRRFVEAYQQVSLLTIGELWALPTMLHLVIVENLSQVAARIMEVQRSGEVSPPSGRSDEADGDRAAAEDSAAVSNCILSLRMLENHDWQEFFESVSRVEQVLRRDPAGVYARMDFDTRDRYRDVVEDLARQTRTLTMRPRWSEEEVAQEAINLARDAMKGETRSFGKDPVSADIMPAGCRRSADRASGELHPAAVSPRGAQQAGYHRSCTSHVGFFLVDAGRAQLEDRLGYHPPRSASLRRWLLRHPVSVYLGGITLVALVVLGWLLCYAAAAGGSVAQLLGVVVLVSLPASAVAVDVVNWLVAYTMPAQLLPRLDFQEGVPAECCTMVVIPALVKGVGEVEFLLQQLERHFLGNVDPNVRFALLSDFADAPRRCMPDDGALLDCLKRRIRDLNRKYSQRSADIFYLFHRDREWNPGEGCWMGWERKRGKLIQFNRLVLGDGENPFSVQIGAPDFLPKVRYVITLDADTVLQPGDACRLISTLAHPLNQAEFDPESGDVIAGYTVLQPRVEIGPASASRTLFARIFAQDSGVDLYTRAVSDVYQDLFGEGSYAGKGIYDVADFTRSLDGRSPENHLLSHDLFEGIYGRAGLVTDIVLYEDYPAYYLAYTRRLHRWVRGDWQLLPWLLPRVPRAGGGKMPNRLSILSRWKIIDNLRRSLLKPALLALLVVGWLWLPGGVLFWTMAGMLTLGGSVLTELLTVLVRGGSLMGAVQPLKMSVLHWLLVLTFLPYEALIVLDAILATLHRLLITRKRRLQWTTSAHTIRLFGKEAKLGVLWRRMGLPAILTLALTWLVIIVRPEAFFCAVPLLFVWVQSPLLAYLISLPATRERAALSTEQCRRLHRLARRTWFYFEHFVGPDDQWLPPDHFQEDPLGLVAHRTSPTNMGLLLLSTVTAYDLGYTGPLDLMLRLRPTFETLSRMERHRGHFLNWYDTRNLRPLPPRYVSTVDSGNLAGCFLALEHALLAMPDAQVFRWQRWQGLLDTLDVLTEIVAGLRDGAAFRSAAAQFRNHLKRIHQRVLAVRDTPSLWGLLLIELGDESWPELERLLISLVESNPDALDADTLRDLRLWSERVNYQLLSMRSQLDMLVPWLLPMSQPPALFTLPEADPSVVAAWQGLVEALPATPALREVPTVCRAARARLDRLRKLLTDGASAEGCGDCAAAPAEVAALPSYKNRAGRPGRTEEARDWCVRLARELDSARMAVEPLLIGYRDLAAEAETYFQDMGFRFLFDPQAKMFHIGYNVDAERLDPYYYDLLASEARIASFVAIAKGEVPRSHWLRLGRPFTNCDGTRALMSWSATSFEYLMPLLLVRAYQGTLLDHSCRAAVACQIAYGNQKGVPWGISESAYYRLTAGMTYHYEAFGVPALGFKRGLGDSLVIAPYASLLALPVDPGAVVRNMRRLVKLDMLGRYGFYESIDYTPSHVPAGQKYAIVRAFYAHHQGMIMVSLGNRLGDQAMVRRFHADLRVQNADLLLREQVSVQAPIELPRPEEVREVREVQSSVSIAPWYVVGDAPLPQGHLLSNGRYSVFITAAGGGYSRWREMDLTRWRADTALDNWGTWIYVHDREQTDKGSGQGWGGRRRPGGPADRASGEVWSASCQPTGSSSSADLETRFHVHKAEFWRRQGDVSLRMEIAVAPDDDVEIRLINLANRGGQLHRLTLTSYGEVVLAPHASDRAHPAFSKLFVESEYLPQVNGLLFRRRPRSAEEQPIYLIHLLAVEPGAAITGAYESDRARFLGRGHTPCLPAALVTDDGDLSGAVGATLDPIMSLSQEVELKARAQVHVAYVTLVAESREDAIALAHRYRDWLSIRHAFEQALSHSDLDLRRCNLDSAQLERIQRLLSALHYPYSALRAAPETLAANTKGQSGLWAYGISGDYPVLLVRTHSQEGIGLLREILQAHAYWRRRQVKVDLVILNEHPGGYNQEFHNRLRRLITRADGEDWMNQRGGIFLLHADQMSEEDRVLLQTVARVVLEEARGSLDEQLRVLRRRSPLLPRFVPTLLPSEGTETAPLRGRPAELLFDNGLGGFSAGGREYLLRLDPGQWTPAPWINVIASPRFGFLVSEAGLGYTWAENSGENRLTPWRNDPVSDTPGEALYLRDEETAQVWSPTPLPAPAAAAYTIRHGAGYSVFEHHSHGLKQRLRVFAVPDAPVKVVQLRLENTWERQRRVTATYYAEWVLGTTREVHQQYIVPEFDAGSHAFLARNPYSEEFSERVAFVAASKELHGLTADRIEFLGRNGSYSRPAALDRIGLAGTVGPGLDPCAALQVHLDLAPGEAQEVFFLLGQGADREDALGLITRYRHPVQVEAAWDAVNDLWDGLLGAVTVRTPDPAMDVLLNRWLLYQALSCRIWGRSALYQSSGAFGYRDQLQDVMALVHAAPQLAREHILRAARHQFEAGDVLHWWHPPSGRGVRTRCSDDLLWLPFVTAHYVAATGDEAILSEESPFLAGDPLGPEELDRYGHYAPTDEVATLYEHCQRALERGTSAGAHGLPLIGSHDWNDGMNRVGVEGRGESVWLGWFLYATLTRFAPLCAALGDEEQAAAYREQAEGLRRALEENAWDWGWYRRAYYDDGTPLGSAESDEAQIDSIAQSWAVLSGGADPTRAVQAMEAAAGRLVRRDDGLILLFTPPFDKTERDPGYIKGYPPGIRENGGQYTHAALWAVWAFAELGQGDRAGALFRLLTPIYHSDTPDKVERYRVEPYVVAADVYSVAPHVGRGGWTWYTGSAAWMYRLGIEAILGLRRVGRALRLDPCIPKRWPGYEIAYRDGDTQYRIRVENPNGVNRGVRQVTLDGEVLPDGDVPLLGDGLAHEVRVWMG